MLIFRPLRELPNLCVEKSTLLLEAWGILLDHTPFATPKFA
jgi:hypothetical protein